MNQAEITRLISGLKIKIGTKPIKYKNPYGKRGSLEALRPSVTSLINEERLKLKATKGTLTRQYTERLISEAILHGDKHQPTMEIASWWLDSDRTAVHKLFKVLVPRFREYTTSYTKLFHAPTEIITTFQGNYKANYGDFVVVELRGNPYPKLAYSNIMPNKKTIHNVLLAEAAKDYKLT